MHLWVRYETMFDPEWMRLVKIITETMMINLWIFNVPRTVLTRMKFKLLPQPCKVQYYYSFFISGETEAQRAPVHVPRKRGARIYTTQNDFRTWVLHPQSWFREDLWFYTQEQRYPRDWGRAYEACGFLIFTFFYLGARVCFHWKGRPKLP